MLRNFMHDQRGGMTILIIALVSALGVMMIGSFRTWDLTPEPPPTSTLIPAPEDNTQENDSIQLRTIGFITVVPSPTSPPDAPNPTDTPNNPDPTNPPGVKPAPKDPDPTSPPSGPEPTKDPSLCEAGAPKGQGCSCPRGEALYCTGSACGPCQGPPSECPLTRSGYCLVHKGKVHTDATYNKYKSNPNCIDFCLDKPVIYLYPEVPTLVDVKLTIPGFVTVSIPEYPTETGWQDVLAHPDGRLVYQGKEYGDLYYETSVYKKVVPPQGLIFAKKNLNAHLNDLMYRYGLNDKERADFMEYWIPRLNEVDKPYILVSVYPHDLKQILDHVDIQPKPDTFIEILVYFKGVEFPYLVQPQPIPSQIPVRKGFTAVEWGGILDE